MTTIHATAPRIPNQRERRGATLVIGLGNPILCDDGVGLKVAERLTERIGYPADVEIQTDLRGGLQVVERMAGFARVVLIDAIYTGAPPGTIHTLGPNDMETQHSASGHDVNLSTGLALCRKLGLPVPDDADITIVGVEVRDVMTFAERCTPAVEAAVDQAAAKVEHMLACRRSS